MSDFSDKLKKALVDGAPLLALKCEVAPGQFYDLDLPDSFPEEGSASIMTLSEGNPQRLVEIANLKYRKPKRRRR